MISKLVAGLRTPEMIVGVLLAAVFLYFIFGDLLGLRLNPPEVAGRADVPIVSVPRN